MSDFHVHDAATEQDRVDDIRQTALMAAIQACGSGNFERVLEAAKAFEAFLSGEPQGAQRMISDFIKGASRADS